MKYVYSFSLVIILLLTSCNQLVNFVKPTNLENISALKEILNHSAFKAAKKLAQLKTKGVEGMLPKELQPVLGTLKTLGYGDEIDKAVNVLGKASTVVADEVPGIMKDAIKQVKFKDAAAIILGGESAATGVFKKAMYGAVKQRYSERLAQELDKTEVNKYWPMAASAHNMFAKKENKVDGKVEDFLAERAVDGLFLAMGKEEKAARADYKSLGKSVVTKVFDYYGSKK